MTKPKSRSCKRCSKIAEWRSPYCKTCRIARDNEIQQNRAAWHRHRNLIRKNKGVCLRCGNAVKPGRTYCQEHLKQASKRLQNLIAKGICPCGKRPTRPSKRSCAVCAEGHHRRSLVFKQRAFAAYGGPQCKCCGETTIEFLSIDHIDGDGAEHRQTIGNRIYRWLFRNSYPSGFQVLCMNCNFAKGQFGQCPHQKLSFNGDSHDRRLVITQPAATGHLRPS